MRGVGGFTETFNARSPHDGLGFTGVSAAGQGAGGDTA
jgi:hypothetical protein